jgi:glyoxylase-like metal-dependent hydrolase (beta-lactamase superfamily II)
LNGNDSLIASLKNAGFSADDVTDMFLTHLHFDHCGGGVKKEGGKLELTFKNAQYWSNEEHWNLATKPNAREKASFLKENILPMQESGQLKFTNENKCPFTQFDILYSSGHTDSMMIPKIKYNGTTVCYMADLLPSVGHLPLPYVMAYDTRPLISLEEKEKFLNEAVDNNYVLFFEHDPVNECCTLVRTERGIRADRTFKLAEL